MEEKERLTPQEPAAEDRERDVLRDERGRRVLDEDGQPIHWATPWERIAAFLLALVVIAITLAFAYSLSTGDLIRR